MVFFLAAKRFVLCGLLFALFSCTTQYTTKESVNNELALKLFPTTQDALSIYKDGIQKIMATLPDVADENNPLFPLVIIRDRVYSKMSWGYIDVNGSMIALEDGSRSGSWVMFYKENHPALKQRNNTLSTMTQGSIVTVVVRPDLISERWAGIFMVHEMSHVLERMYKTKIQPHESEYYAYTVEKIAYNYLSNGNLDKVLDEFLHRNNILNHQALIELAKQPENFKNKIKYEIDQPLDEKNSMSLTENEMRSSFYLMALSIRIGENNDYDEQKNIDGLNILIENFSKFPIKKY